MRLSTMGFVAFGLAGCGQAQSQNSRYFASSLKSVGTNVAATESPSTDGNGPLAPYLLSLTDAQALKPMVQAYIPPSDPNAVAADFQASDPNYSRVQSLISTFANKIGALPALAPGRTFKVTVPSDDTINAMDEYEDLTVYRGMIKAANALSAAAVVCHEMAHSAQNHSALSANYFNPSSDPKAAALQTQITDYISSHFDTSTGTYHHESAAFDPIKRAWSAFWAQPFITMKRHESIADIIGSQICGAAGFTATEYINGASTLLGSLSKGQQAEAAEPVDGDYSYGAASPDEVMLSLLGMDNHPTGAERTAQLQRVATLVVTDATQTIAGQWKANYESARGGAGGVSLTDGPQPGLVLIDQGGLEIALRSAGDDCSGAACEPKKVLQAITQNLTH